MGAVSRDLDKKYREYDELYAYNPDGVANLLRDIYKIGESRWYNGDIDATAIMIDLYSALDGDCLTPRMRQVVALYYFAGLTEEEAAEILQITRIAVTQAKNKAVERVSSAMFDGTTFKKGDPYELDSRKSVLYEWLNEVASTEAPVYEVSQPVFNAINEMFAHKDDKASEVLRQRAGGIVTIVEDSGEDEYPCLSDEQFRWKDRRMTYKPTIYPKADVVGSVKVAVCNEEDKQGVEWRVERRKLFKVRGN